MGPITLFDKSFLQSLSVDESVWFDNFFLPVVAPFFYVETLADLAKEPRRGMTPEAEVARIADKFPEMHGTPCAHHQQLVAASLMGHPIPMEGRIVVSGGRPIRSGDDTGIVFDQAPEAKAFSRWARSEFEQLEREFAQEWRDQMAALDLDEIARLFREIGLDASRCKSLDDVWAETLSHTSDMATASNPLALSLAFLGADADLRTAVLARHRDLGFPRFSVFAPYAAFVLSVEVFFQLAVGAGLIQAKPSSRVDIAYLFYLPFCMLFVSSDRLHERCARFFLRDDQAFLWGHDLKDGLQQLNHHYMRLPEEVRKQGVMKFAHWPPVDDDFLVTRIFDASFPGWRDRANDRRDPMDPEAEKRLVEELHRRMDGPSIPGDELGDFDPEESTFRSIQRMVRKTKGSWNQVPEDIDE